MESTYSRCIFSRPFKNGFNSSCVSTINCTCLSPISGLVRYAIAALICSLLDETKRGGGGRGRGPRWDVLVISSDGMTDGIC